MTLELIKAVSSRATCLYSEQDVEMAIDAMANAISGRLHAHNPILLCIMNGGLILTGRLATRLKFPLQMDYLHATRYRNKTRGAGLHWDRYPGISLEGRQVLVIDDILDEGDTLAAVMAHCQALGVRDVLSAVLVDKQHDRKTTNLKADFVGLEVPDHYLYGYGMDYKGYLRNAPGIFAVDPADCD
ncbi:MAG TPA: hypoxanthine-guanine phosphoribosyltransferase [Gammaproteobacteria bacterium]|nr:hypoxanthine-guanine phosphoribosyltransferase [Gammaproteobacteria bacterium]HCA36396.1 hypoxanthine-guanine phosphoribosyltransferase [Gammaproteobacteria bacterium]